LLALPTGTALAGDEYQVVKGDSLYKIAKKYDCTVEQLERANELDGDTIFAGQTIVIPDCQDDAVGPKTKAKKKSKSKKAIRDGNPDPADYDLTPAPKKVKAQKGQSIGKPWSGKLKNASKLAKGKGYFIRRPERAYGANYVVTHVEKAIKAVRKRFPRVHTVAIGDISAKTGGDIGNHHSHESGRDVDIGFYFKKKPAGYPDSFVAHNDAKLDLAATWALVYAFARTADQANGVKVIFLGRDVQKRLYVWAKDHSVPETYLDKVFQYGNDDAGLVRHEPNHDDHIHVRFKCPDKDTGCED
jgi:murein endopeptidase